MSTHNIGFYEDLTKIIFELSSNIIKIRTLFLLLDKAKLIMYITGDNRICLQDHGEKIQTTENLLTGKYELCLQKTDFLHMRKQRRRSASR